MLPSVDMVELHTSKVIILLSLRNNGLFKIDGRILNVS